MTLSKTFFKAAEAGKPASKKAKPVFHPAIEETGSAVIDQGITKPVITIDIEPAKENKVARLILFFSVKPDSDIRSKLKARNFWYHPSNNGWSHIDTPETRSFVNELFGAKLEINETKEYNDQKESPINAPGRDFEVNPIPTYTPELIVAPEREPEPVSPELARYRSQVDDLIEYLKCPPADLLLMAIDAYHKQIFSRPN